ncbi:Eco57I restriction-modification methylase domain-containing protein [Halopiger goleimassiliensis]|uniref:Eco57I restriction-modification methylase domain-containing protein n=1 Tax=Halopiger goleimassiliensis TaxID=1293048 RepID=UPI00067801B1|nr:N-6 DNA methylase [Halopiger goleimassiliensis]
MARAPSYRTNRGLFARSSLTSERFATEAHFEEARDPTSAFEAIEGLWERVDPPANERSGRRLETAFVRPVLRVLGYPVSPDRPDDDAGDGQLRNAPDVLVPTVSSEDLPPAARPDRSSDDDPVAVVNVYRPGRPFDDVDRRDTDRAAEVPAARMHAHLEATGARWGLLTDGRRWRLYHAETSERLDCYYELDLATLLEREDSRAGREFVATFRYEAVAGTEGRDPFLESLIDERAVAVERLLETLPEHLARAAGIVARASDRDRRAGGEAPTGRDRAAAFERAAGFVLRLVVCRFAESRAGVTFGERGTPHSTVGGLGREVASRLEDDGLLEGVDAVVDGGSVAAAVGHLEIGPRLERAVAAVAAGPDGGVAYDGWLLGESGDRATAPDTATLPIDRVDEAAVARAILLATHRPGDDGGWRPIDYAALAPRQLGRLYEGLLAWELAVASEPLALEDGTYVPTQDDAAAIGPGDPYLESDCRGRKATGAYYTPADVVDYVVRETMSPLCAEIRQLSSGGGDDRQPSLQQSADDTGFVDRLTALRLLDPAMGSGHFLLRASEFLTREAVRGRERAAARGDPGAIDGGRSVGELRRRIATTALFGVDLDPLAVEVATASLWLRTMRADAEGATGPRDGLATTLRSGNAIVGADPDGRIRDALLEGGEAESTRRTRLGAAANVRTASAFGLECVPDDAVERLFEAVDDDGRWERLSATGWFERAQEWAAAGRYLHWPLAYPDVLGASSCRNGGDDAKGPASGFDAVLGNPPWVATAGRADVSACMESELREYLADAFDTTENQFDCYVAVYERALALARNGRVGIVVPDAILARESNEPIRSAICDRTSLSRIVRLGARFEDVETGAVAIVTGGDTDSGDTDAVRCADATDRDRLENLSYTEIPASVFASRPKTRFLPSLDETAQSIVERLERWPPLERFVTIARGEEIGKNDSRLETTPAADRRPIAPGGAIVPYGIDESALRYVEPETLEKDPAQYRGPKLVFRQTGDAFVGTLTDEVCTIKSAYTIRPLETVVDAWQNERRGDAAGDGSSVDRTRTERQLLAHLLGVLQSPLLNYYHHYVHAAYRSVFPQINQSTFERLPIAMPDGPDPTLVEAVEERLALTTDRDGIEADVLAYLPDAVDGPTLGSLEASRPVDDVEGTLLTETGDSRPSLKVDAVTATTERTDGETATRLSIELRYKPDDDHTATDGWGYARTDPIPALRITTSDDDLATLLEAFVPRAVERADGFAGFRRPVTATTSPLDRLRAVRLPTTAGGALAAFRDARKRLADLEADVAAVDRTIHERVCSLYGIPADERAVVRDEFGSDRTA